MKYHIRLIAVCLCLLTLVSFMKPAEVAQAASCVDASGSGSGATSPTGNVPVYTGQVFTFTWNIPGAILEMDGTFAGQPFSLNGTNSVSFTGIAPSDGTWGWSRIFIDPGNAAVNQTWSWSAVCPGGKTSPLFPDGRLNNNDAQETAAIYCKNGGVTVYVPAEPKWIRAFHVSAAEINKVPKNPAEHTLIKQGKGARLYRLTSGELQVNTPELDPTKGDYVFIFEDCS
jgi:hypothetical protein